MRRNCIREQRMNAEGWTHIPTDRHRCFKKRKTQEECVVVFIQFSREVSPAHVDTRHASLIIVRHSPSHNRITYLFINPLALRTNLHKIDFDNSHSQMHSSPIFRTRLCHQVQMAIRTRTPTVTPLATDVWRAWRKKKQRRWVRVDYLLILCDLHINELGKIHLQYGAGSDSEHYTQQKVIYSNTSAASGGNSNLNELDTLLKDLSNARYGGGVKSERNS